MLNKLRLILFGDIRSFGSKAFFILAILMPLESILSLLYCFPDVTVRDQSSSHYYTFTAITLISFIPFFFGLAFGFTDRVKPIQSSGIVDEKNEGPFSHRNIMIRIAGTSVMTFVVILPVIFITDAVSTEGWLRSIYISALLAIMTPFISQVVYTVSAYIRNRIVISLITALFPITVPLGLLLHHPWNYLAFYSPFYWISWAWIIPYPGESLTYGIIAFGIYCLYSVIFLMFFMRRRVGRF